ncbi:MAG TPA: substrate-binding domain-containing protein [Candidatus Scatomonas merdavium]|nr:substrate-binding domain-containing protein [Candidatus Scatomonas merdavium]
MKRKLAALVMAGAMAFSLAACGGEEAADSTSASTSQSTADTSSASSADSSSADSASSSSASSADSSSADSTSTSSESTGEAEIRSTGPNGETAVNADTLSLTDEQKEEIRGMGLTAAISMHYGGNDWATAQIQGLTDTFEDLGIELLTTTDANFSAEQQVSDIENIMTLDPDILISIPVDATASADAYMRAAEAGITIVFMDNCPVGMTAGEDYVSVVSADNYGNGCIAAEILGETLGGEGDVGMVYYDADFFVSNQRDQGFKDTMAEKYPDINIVTEQGFTDENGCSEQGDAILTQYPNINGIYASWDIPMEGVLSSVRAAGMEGQIALTTIDLGNNIALEIANGTVAGLGAQMPYDQGVAEATLAAMSILGEECPSYVAVPAKRVDSENVLDAYEDVYHTEAPDWLVSAKNGEDVDASAIQ